MKIGIIGSGNVGGALGKIWARNGHEIMFSSRNPEKLKPLAEAVGKNACFGLPSDAARFGDVVVLAVPWEQAESALLSAGSLNGKILIDCTNPPQTGLQRPGGRRNDVRCRRGIQARTGSKRREGFSYHICRPDAI